MSLSEAQLKTYTILIDGILANADLTTVSAKKVRVEIQKHVDHDIGPYKTQISALIGERFDVASAAQIKAEPVPSENSSSSTPAADYTNGDHVSKLQVTSNGVKRSSSDDTVQRPIKKQKPVKVAQTAEEKDAEFAARLQAEENGRARSTRGGGSAKRKAPIKKDKAKKKKLKSKNKVGSDDDSIGGSDAEKSVKRNGGFHKPMLLSEPLVALLGETALSRPQTVKKIWEYIKANDLQDPDDKRQIRCDDSMRSVFKQDKVHMFTMNKILSQNLYPIEDTIET